AEKNGRNGRGGLIMSDTRKGDAGMRVPSQVLSSQSPSRRSVLGAGAALVAGATAAEFASERASAQNPAADPELVRLQSQRRILIKGGVVLTLDGQDLAQGDVLIEDGKIREVRAGITAADDMAVVDASNRVLIPGFVDTHSHSYQGLLRSTLPNGRVDPDYNRDVQNNLTLHYQPA